MPAIQALAKQTSTKLVTFAMCAFGAEWQKETTPMYTAGLDAWFDSLDQRVCEHATHAKVAGGDKTSDGWNSSVAAAYPPDFNSFVAQAFANLVRQRQSSALDPKPDVPVVSGTRPRASSGAPAATASVSPAPTEMPLSDVAADTSTAGAIDATSARKLDFGKHELSDIHEEPDAEELPDTLDQPAEVVVPHKKPSKPKVTFEKTAGARGTRSNNPTVIRGLGTSTGFTLLSLGTTLSSAVFAMGTVDLIDELSKPDSSLSAALAKPSTIDPKTQKRKPTAWTSPGGWRPRIRSSKTMRTTAVGNTSTLVSYRADAGSSSSCGSTRSSATAPSNRDFVYKAVDRCPAWITTRHGVAPCAALRCACSPTSPPTPA